MESSKIDDLRTPPKKKKTTGFVFKHYKAVPFGHDRYECVSRNCELTTSYFMDDALVRRKPS